MRWWRGFGALLVGMVLGLLLAWGGMMPALGAPPAGVQWVTHKPGDEGPNRWQGLEYEYPTGVGGNPMGRGTAIEQLCRKKYHQVTDPDRFTACHEAGMAKEGTHKAQDIPEAITKAAVDPYAKEAKESSVRAMQTMMRAVTWAWTTPTFNPQVATVTRGACADDQSTPTAGSLGADCYRTAKPLIDIRRDLDPLIAIVTVCAVLLACGRIAIEQRADGMVALGRAMAMVMVVSSMLAIVTQAAITVADGITTRIMSNAPNEKDNGLQNAAAMLGNPDTEVNGLSFLVIIVMAILIVLAAAAQMMLLIFRMAVLPALIAWAPVAAASSSTQVGSQWLHRTLMTILAFIIYKPVAAGTYVLGLRMLSFSASDEQLKAGDPVRALVSVLAALTLLLICVVALPALMRWLVPMTSPGMSSMFSGGALAAGAVTGAVALSGAVSAAGAAGSAGGRGMAAAGPATAGIPMAGGGSGGGGSSSAPTALSAPEGAVSTPGAGTSTDGHSGAAPTSGGAVEGSAPTASQGPNPEAASPAGGASDRATGQGTGSGPASWPGGSGSTSRTSTSSSTGGPPTAGSSSGSQGTGAMPAGAAGTAPSSGSSSAGSSSSGVVGQGASLPGGSPQGGAPQGVSSQGARGVAGDPGRDGRRGRDVPQGSAGGRSVGMPPVPPVPPVSGVFDDGEGSHDGVY